MEAAKLRRRLPAGAEVLPGGGVHFRVWASRRKRVEVVVESGGGRSLTELEAEDGGYFSGVVDEARDGTLYRFRLDGDDYLYPDPASRFQPEGPHGPSRVVDPSKFRWTDGAWKGAALKGQIIYELHVGTFTRRGTWEAAARELKELAGVGVTCIELMPVAEFPGRFGWGYDGVGLFAPTRLYGEPDDLRRFVDEAHAAGIAVILDVVYNHLGPDGNYLPQFSADYFTDRFETDWGDPINFDGPGSGPVREFILANARYWVEEFHMDGLRLDATQNIYDDSEDHIIAAVVREVRAAARGRETIIVGENEPQHTNLVRPPEQGGYGLDALWNDDFHHSAMVALDGHNEAYYTDYLGKPQEFISAVKYGYLYQGQHYKWQKKRRGSPGLDLKPEHFINFIQNHDQLANSGQGERAHRLTGPGRFRAMTALVLLAPGTPMLFQGQEFAASAPFFYFADHEGALAEQVRGGREKFLRQFPSIATAESQACIPVPHDPATFERCKLDFEERERHAGVYALHRDLLKLRREDPVFKLQRKGGVDGAVLGPEAFVLRFFADDGQDRLLVVNFGTDIHLDPAPEPLLAPPRRMRWGVLWSSESVAYGGCGTPPPDTDENWRITGHAAVALAPTAADVESEDTSSGADNTASVSGRV
jgi:maltooligosyltrehalose trehalohydrolase